MPIQTNQKYILVNTKPSNNSAKANSSIDLLSPWKHNGIVIGGLNVKSRTAWGAREPIWRNELIYYNTLNFALPTYLNRIVVHHTNNSNSIAENERKQQGKSYAALGYHYLIGEEGSVYEGRPIEIMGSHAGRGKVTGPTNDPDWGAIGIVLQGDFHHADDWFFSSEATKKQLGSLEALILGLKNRYAITTLLMHREVNRGGTPTVCPGDHLAEKVTTLRTKLNMAGGN